MLYLDAQCATLVLRTKGLEMVCYNGYNYTTGEAYEGDTCSFTCSSGYELTGSLTRTCQSDGSWSGNEAVCNRGKKVFACMDCEVELTYHIYQLGFYSPQAQSQFNFYCHA